MSFVSKRHGVRESALHAKRVRHRDQNRADLTIKHMDHVFDRPIGRLQRLSSKDLL
jgi:hypothetical protein